jgi:hypothetical protein
MTEENNTTNNSAGDERKESPSAHPTMGSEFLEQFSRRQLLQAGSLSALSGIAGCGAFIYFTQDDGTQNKDNDKQVNQGSQDDPSSIYEIEKEKQQEYIENDPLQFNIEYNYDPVTVSADENEEGDSRLIRRIVAAPSESVNGDRILIEAETNAGDNVKIIFDGFWIDKTASGTFESDIDGQTVQFDLFDGEVMSMGISTKAVDDPPELFVVRGNTLETVRDLINSYSDFYTEYSSS